MNQTEQEPQKGGEITKNVTQRAKELPKLIPVTKLMYSRSRTCSLIIHQVIHKRNQTWFVRVFRKLIMVIELSGVQFGQKSQV